MPCHQEARLPYECEDLLNQSWYGNGLGGLGTQAVLLKSYTYKSRPMVVNHGLGFENQAQAEVFKTRSKGSRTGKKISMLSPDSLKVNTAILKTLPLTDTTIHRLPAHL